MPRPGPSDTRRSGHLAGWRRANTLIGTETPLRVFLVHRVSLRICLDILRSVHSAMKAASLLLSTVLAIAQTVESRDTSNTVSKWTEGLH